LDLSIGFFPAAPPEQSGSASEAQPQKNDYLFNDTP
jgi:hypothetical protein